MVPPSLYSFSLGKIENKVIFENETNEIKLNKISVLTLTSTLNVFEENDLGKLLGNVSKLIEQPLNISL